MADTRRLGLTPQLDIEQILREAQHRWLRPAEICEILRNYHKFHIAPEPPNKPPNGSLFLFDRKVLRYFRKDGHNWRKKKDGKTVKEAHEKLKAGSVDVLHCYYAHGEDNESFQRRSYWMLEEELMHIVLVHYREVKGSKLSYLQQREDGEPLRNSNPDSPACSNSSVNLSQMASQVSDYGSTNSTQQTEYEDIDSADNYQTSSRYHSFSEMQQYGPWMNVQFTNACAPGLAQHDQSDYQRVHATLPDINSFTVAQESLAKSVPASDAQLKYFGSTTITGVSPWHEIFENCPTGFQTPYDVTVSSRWTATSVDNLERNSLIQDIFTDDLKSQEDGIPNVMWQILVPRFTVKGRFLLNEEDLHKYKWSSMFGEIEVPANVYTNGTLCCHAPPYKSGRAHFYITCSNRVACSEIREFEYKVSPSQNVPTPDPYYSSEPYLQSRFEELLLLDSVDCSIPACGHLNERSHEDCTTCSLIMELGDEVINIFKHNPSEVPFATKNQIIEEQLKQKLHVWLLHKVGEDDGKGPNTLTKEGQGVLHLAAALGYNWAIKPIVAAGVNINFRDVYGWTAMHWAAFCGRERTVVTLIALDASPGALTDPTPEFPSGRTPADLASQNGHKGIAGFLAESSLTNHLRALTLKESESRNLSRPSGLLGFDGVSDKVNTHLTDGEIQTSLSAVRNATEAAARIFQVFRVQSFNRKRIIQHNDDNRYGLSDARALSLLSFKPSKSGLHDMPVHAAAIKIQNKFRGWKGRKEFLITRQRIVRIQAHVRGHQVRKHYKKIIWSVGIVEKIILRWRRKGSGLRGFRPEGLIEGQNTQSQASKEDDYDFLQVGRKQSEARLEKALARVKSMVQYPEARDQYKRLVTVVTEMQESKLMQAEPSDEIGEPSDTKFVMEIEGLLGDYDTMPEGL